ncbi:hypothetical protein NQ317_019262 [Molorchus minor]|uniref:Uncharacterized protein n=1 Tax=Molorchus minor TaxID=1323400 RepID=A0ABQ9IR57_9CUCU|nr:hypothetical protein NQ317_019262 [Molorchus minor]
MNAGNFVKLFTVSAFNCSNSCRRFAIRKFSVKSNTEETVIEDGPIRYSKSAASQYKAKSTRVGNLEPRLWYESYVILVSLTVFLLYFTVVREENDIDQDLSRSLYSRISGLEQLQLKLSLEYNRQHGLETEAILERLKEIESRGN